ncbi:hypothetical protein [Phytohabitans houttuyneae]|uniref:Uncharacterized protein n=1 Tax=Phytohabitans houttuyneae TaxID=1076126 RepID=A0A6V8KAN1_9ACTN|nr:hypothetical protein [Phytohabitans houttuyneae]GFJ82303.1 hypothetical protein Phou_064830 [Phytohabitans houttuyneae]
MPRRGRNRGYRKQAEFEQREREWALRELERALRGRRAANEPEASVPRISGGGPRHLVDGAPLSDYPPPP